ncbi:4'-phosphopantetheinyl transferase family protein [Corynebacterium sp. H113]|uniref:4'-phosphopantetheinyl transferase family protein n=1 Tax=Corynebacterium sp. H113 TaxID=3133419 RepID=UPI0030B7D323
MKQALVGPMIATTGLPIAVVEEGGRFACHHGLQFPEEAVLVEGSVAKRMQDFADGRWCAHAAMESLTGMPVDAQAPILRGATREPLWPANIVGSITHTDGWVAAATALSSNIASVGIDVESARTMPPSTLKEVASDSERRHLHALSCQTPDAQALGVSCVDSHSLDVVLFSAKESIYKAWFPLTHEWLGFDEVDLRIEAGHTFTARVLRSIPDTSSIPAEHLSTIRGVWRVGYGYVATAAIIPAATGSMA